MPLPIVLALVVPTALGAEPGWYHPDDVAAASELFTRAASASSARFDDAQRRLEAASTDLRNLDLDVSLCGSAASPEFRAWATDLRKQTTGRYLQVQAFVDVLTGDFEKTFGEALQRAVQGSAAQYEAVECRAPRVAGMPGAGTCKGTNLNPILAAAMDRDAVLQANVQEILSIPWPAFSIQGQAQPVIPVTGTDRFVYLDVMREAFLADRVRSLQAGLKADLEPLEADMEEGESPEKRTAATEQARVLRQAYEASLSVLGTHLFDALGPAFQRAEKAGAPGSVGVCPNPPRLGGCAGQDVTAALLPLLTADRKLQKALR